MRRLARLFLLFVAACGARPARPQLTLCAAASLRNPLGELVPAAERACDAELVLDLGSSGDLARRIVASPQVDVFVSADEEELQRVVDAGLVEPDSVRPLLSNQLVVIEPADERASLFHEPFDPAQLAQLERLSLANPDTVPAGKYARAWLEQRGAWEPLRERVLPAIDVRAALAAVESGEVRAGIVYRTDAARSTRVRVVFAVPTAEGPRIVYPLAVIAHRPDPERARRLAAFLASPEATATFERHGFVPLARSQ